jgi:hypothetical protein
MDSGQQSVADISTFRFQLAEQNERFRKFQYALQEKIAQANGEVIHTKRLLDAIGNLKESADNEMGMLRQEIENEDKGHHQVREEMVNGQRVLGNFREKLTEEIAALELCAYENQLVMRTLQIDVTPTSISVPIENKGGPDRAGSEKPK